MAVFRMRYIDDCRKQHWSEEKLKVEAPVKPFLRTSQNKKMALNNHFMLLKVSCFIDINTMKDKTINTTMRKQ